MADTSKYASLHEDLRAMPLVAAIRDLMRTQIEQGADPLDVAEAALAVATGLALDINGPERVAAGLLKKADIIAATARQHDHDPRSGGRAAK